MEKFFKLFKRNIKTERLQLRILEPTMENAKIVWDAIKNEDQKNFKFIFWSPKYKKPLPESLHETLETMKQDARNNAQHGVVWYVFYKGKLVGHHGIFYFDSNNSVKSGEIWFITAAQRHGFNSEVFRTIEKIAFEKLKANRIGYQCDAKNIGSKKSIMKNKYHIDGRIRDSYKYPDGTYSDMLIFTKLAREYKK